jgi:peptide/nickel transport system ATP-binding protein
MPTSPAPASREDASTLTAPAPLLEIRDLEVSFPRPGGGWLTVVRGVSLQVGRGEVVGLVGESGSGKTLTALSVLRLVPPPARISGQIRLDGTGDLLALPDRELRQVRGGRIGFVFQEPMAALNPVYTIGFQVAEAVRAHRQISRREARAEAVRLLDRVALADAKRRLDDYPHRLSGGQRQRVGIAMALAAGPDLLLADEPTTALDVTLQAQILELLDGLRTELGVSILLITHDLGIVAERCDRVAVMQNGEIVETAGVEELFTAPAHAYTRALLGALTPNPSPAPPTPSPGEGRHHPPPLVLAQNLTKHFPVRRGLFARQQGTVRAVDQVDLEIRRGECLALVGESGSGKTTLGRCLIRLVEPTSGSVLFDGEDLLGLGPRELRSRRHRFQMVFQDPWGSLDPRQRVGAIVAEPLTVHERIGREEKERRVAELLVSVGLDPALASRWPHQLSGGQRQRVGIARALAAGPDLLVADEPVSALDVSIRSQILDLLASLRERLGLTLLFVSHDLGAVARLADRVAVLYLGRVVELASVTDLFQRPLHPYTVSLLSAVPVADPRPRALRHRDRIVLPGEPPSPLAPPSGCPFHPRCPSARGRCAIEAPPLTAAAGEPERAVACFYPGELTASVADMGSDAKIVNP